MITKGGKPVAAMDSALFERIRLMNREVARLTDELAAAYREVDVAAAQEEIDAAVRAVRNA